MELKEWLEKREKPIAERWKARVRSREEREGEEGPFLDAFMETLVHFLPFCMGPDRECAEQVWAQATHLFGSFALHRGLAAGEVVEELASLREEILKLLMEDPPSLVGLRRSQMEMLALNRALDQATVRASVAYVDDLFFTYLQGSGVPQGMTSELEEEMSRQLQACKRELDGSRAGQGYVGPPGGYGGHEL